MKGFLFTGDMHLRDSTPKCRTDDFIKAQWKKIQYIGKLCRKHDLYWIDAGDIFHKANSPIKLINETLFQLHRSQIKAAIYGNHDLPGHNMARASESAWDTLYHAGTIDTILCDEHTVIPIPNSFDVHMYGASYGEEIPVPTHKKNCINVLVMHEMVYENKNSAIPNVPGAYARNLLKKHAYYNLIVSGHNHQNFQAHVNNRMLANIGCLTRQTTEFEDYIPRVLVWYPTGGWEWITLPHEQNVISKQHIEKQEKKEEELNAFVESLQGVSDVSLSFEDNVEAIIHQVKPEKPVVQKVREAME